MHVFWSGKTMYFCSGWLHLFDKNSPFSEWVLENFLILKIMFMMWKLRINWTVHLFYKNCFFHTHTHTHTYTQTHTYIYIFIYECWCYLALPDIQVGAHRTPYSIREKWYFVTNNNNDIGHKEKVCSKTRCNFLHCIGQVQENH